jgi:hypothetical protein
VAVAAEQVALGLHLGVEEVLHLVEGGGLGVVVHQASHASVLAEEVVSLARLALGRLFAVVEMEGLLVSGDDAAVAVGVLAAPDLALLYLNHMVSIKDKYAIVIY